MAGNNYSPTTRFQNGVTNAAPWQTMGNAGTPDPTWAYQIFDDFNFKDTNKWNLGGIGTPSWAVGTNVNGIAAVTTTAAATDASSLYNTGGYVGLGTKPVFFKCSVSLARATAGSGEFGLSDAPTSAGGNGVYFQYSGGAFTFQVKNGAYTLQQTLPGFAMSGSIATQTELGFYYDGRGWIYIYINPTTGDNTPINAGNGQPRGYIAALQPTSFTPNALATKAHYLAAGDTAGNTMYLDYLLTSAER